MLCVGSPAKEARGTGAIAVYIYSLKNRPYTVIIMMKLSTVMNRPPSSVTAHKGIDAKKPVLLIASFMLSGSTVLFAPANPAAVIIRAIKPCTILKSAIISSKP
jgi:hypothetical protein